MIKVNSLTKIYKIYDSPRERFKEALRVGKREYGRTFYALNDVSFNIGKGEVVGIVGRNGSGKSTILKILTGVLTATSGTIEVNGRVSALLELGAGFNPEYTGLKNIYLNASMMHVTKSEIERKIPDILEFADIGEYISQPVKTYSSGMFVRLAFAVAINVDPEILIVDEALAVGDTRFQLKCMDKFIDFMKQGKTILFVSHDINSIKRFCNRAIWLNEGKLIMDGNTDYVTDHYMDFLKSDLSIDEFRNNIIEEQTEQAYEEISETELQKIDIVEIIEIKLLDEKKNTIDSIKHGESVCVHVKYAVSDEKIDGPVLGVAIRRVDNEYICGLNTKLDGVRIPWKRGLNEVELAYQGFNLTGGEYYFDVGIFDKTGIVNLAYKSKLKTFFVNMDYIAEGVVVLNHKWF